MSPASKNDLLISLPPEDQERVSKIENQWQFFAVVFITVLNKFHAYAFGLASILLLFIFVFEPIMDRLQSQNQFMNKMTSQLEEVTDQNHQTSQYLQNVTAIMDRITSRIVYPQQNGAD